MKIVQCVSCKAIHTFWMCPQCESIFKEKLTEKQLTKYIRNVKYIKNLAFSVNI